MQTTSELSAPAKSPEQVKTGNGETELNRPPRNGRGPQLETNGYGNGNHVKQDKQLIRTLLESKIYQDYERAFSQSMGLPLALHPTESWQLPHHGKRAENKFCAILAKGGRSCAACLRVQQELCEKATDGPKTVTCTPGLCDTAVPVRVGERLIGFLQTGQVFRKAPTDAQFERASKFVESWGLRVDRTELRDAFFKTPVVSAKQHESIVKLLTIFAQHLSILMNQLLIQQDNAEPPVISRAKDFIRDHQTEDLTLGQVAKAVNTSPFYFCKIFKKAVGLNFTEYLSRLRVERAKNLLLNPNLRVSEIAYEVGFQSLTHFNRVFKRITGVAPTEYRQQLPLR